MPNAKLKSRDSKQWIDVGFQGKDPATDFRGAGILGLEQLLFISDANSKHKEMTMKFFEASLNRSCWYFFAVAGLNITKKLLVTLKEGKSEALMQTIIANWEFFEEEFYKRRVVDEDCHMAYNNYDDSQELQRQKQLKSEKFLRQECVLWDLFNHLYFTYLKLFNEYWLDQKHDIMKFNQFINQVIYN